jgi:hypothetical protein
MNFPNEILNAVDELRKRYRSKSHCVIAAYPIIEIIKVSSSIDISTKFFYDFSTKTFEMQAPDHRFHSKISHYDFRKAERRWIRNKGHLFTLIRDLKHSGLWQFISNKNMIIVNSLNDKANPEELLLQLNKITKS